MKKAFGTPSYPSPLDRIRTGRKDRASQLGLSFSKNASFEGNQSFPKPTKTHRKSDLNESETTGPDSENSLDKSLKDFDGNDFDIIS